MEPYCELFQPHIQFWPYEQIRNSLLWLVSLMKHRKNLSQVAESDLTCKSSNTSKWKILEALSENTYALPILFTLKTELVQKF